MSEFLKLSRLVLLAGIISSGLGCGICPEVHYRPQYHNPFPQLRRVAVLPFYNQSNEPTLNVDMVTSAYYAELQTIPGFEVMPTAVVANQWRGFLANRVRSPDMAISGAVFQEFAQALGVDALVVGSVTDFEPYYPPRLAMTVHWYAANSGFHPIPAGYGLPWGTKGEENIPGWVVQEAESELARQQLTTQTPIVATTGMPSTHSGNGAEAVMRTAGTQSQLAPPVIDGQYDPSAPAIGSGLPNGEAPTMPRNWPDPLGFVPEGPSPVPIVAQSQQEPIISHTRIYNGADEKFTERLSAYFELRDDARFGGWQNYLARSDDFVRFCCHTHITDMLELRGGRDESDMILRWGLSRYSR
jgi:hypothetical protein